METQRAFAWIQVAINQNSAPARITSLHPLLNCNYIWIECNIQWATSRYTAKYLLQIKPCRLGNVNWNLAKGLAQSPIYQLVSFVYHPQRYILAFIWLIGGVGSVARAWQNAKMGLRPWRATTGRRILKLTLLVPIL